MRVFPLVCALGLTTALPLDAATATTLRGSPNSMVRQHEIARENDYSFVRDAAAVRRMVEQGHLVRVRDGAGHRLSNVSFPYARPAVAKFIERLGVQYQDACGERLVVTSLTRPTSLQPKNAHQLSVHPAGMAVDLRVSGKQACRAWLEATLLSLENRGLLDATREKRPPHYHVAVYPQAYEAHVERLTAREPEATPAPTRPTSKRKVEEAFDSPLIAALRSPEARTAIDEPVPAGNGRRAPWSLVALIGLVSMGLASLLPGRLRR